MKTKKHGLATVSLVLVSALGSLGAETSRVEQALTVNEVPELRGYLGERWEANRKGSLHGFDIEYYVGLVERRDHRDWWWAGEQDGKWLESAVLSSVHSDPVLRKKAKSILDRIIASQEPNGYVGITSPDVRSDDKPLRGMDPYEDYFRLHGLMTAYEQWGDKDALECAKNFGDYLVEHIGPGKAEFWPSDFRPPENENRVLTGFSDIAGHAVHYSWEGTMLLDPMLRLALATHDKKYVKWSEWVVDNIDRWSGWDSFSKLDQVADGTMGIHEVQPYVHSHTFHMNFLGFLRLYEITGDSSYLRKVEGVWDDIASRQMFITGGVSVGEHYESGHVRPVTGHVVETCATMSWLQITQYLLELTGDVKYADAMEKLLWNHVFAAQSIDGDTYRYHTAPNGVKPEGYFHGPDCCTSSGHRMVALLPTFLYGKDEKGVFINQYGATTADVELSDERSMRLRQDTAYPEKSLVAITVEQAPEDISMIRLRIPSWCQSPSLKLNGKVCEGLVPGRYYKINRVWSVGDKLELNLPMELKWVRSDAPWRTKITHLPGGEIMHEPIDGDTPPWALTRGPIVYAADTIWWDSADVAAPGRIGEDLAIVPDLSRVREISKPGDVVGPVYEAEFVTGSGQTVAVPMVPFTNIGQWYRPGEARPDRNAAAYSYAVWFVDQEAPVFKEKLQESEKLKELRANSVDYIFVGNAQSEGDHQVSGGTVGAFNNRHYRHGQEFSYVVKVPQGVDGKLVVTYWGDDVNREFDILADGEKLGTQRLQANRPGQFFDASYVIPASLTLGRTDAYGQKVDEVAIRFKVRSGDVAGGVFGVRVEAVQ